MDVREIRKVRGWSQTEFGVVMGWSRQRVQRFESGEDPDLTAEEKVRLHRILRLGSVRIDQEASA